ncbi:mannitol-1-phosphate 5-dehydrogenase [Rubrobacter indicoceani]|uniref:mannitol-1-phosphate 5-dehydrogenase n=1 Tax=Rubrobacter indicoceani TaxID=2051957 RepID=UPI000E5B0F37|nr:mannitol-1-phosphate 5-dehydrogenase [Rubrobacter indicoceani]
MPGLKALHFGAGNIGRGFIGLLLSDAGYGVTFADVRDEVVDALKREGRYEVVLAGELEERVPVEGVRAVHSVNEAEELVRLIATADLITTAVGPNVLPVIAGAVAEGLTERAKNGGSPVNVIACENMVGGSAALQGYVVEKVAENDREAVGRVAAFPNAAVDRIVPEQPEGSGLDVLVEPFSEWVVDESQLVGGKPEIEGVTYVEDLGPYIDRKLLTVNTGHAAVAYLGHAGGKRTISESLADEAVWAEASGALEETGTLVVEKHGFDAEEHRRYREKTLMRFTNPAISDSVRRVARTPIRKLGHEERLVSPALQLIERGYTPEHLARVIKSVLAYSDPDDEQSVELREAVESEGERAAFARYAGIPEDHPLVELVARERQRVGF